MTLDSWLSVAVEAHVIFHVWILTIAKISLLTQSFIINN